MALTDQRKTIIAIINEVRRKMGLSDAAQITTDKHSRVALDYLNDVISEVNDYDNWQEVIRETLVTASSSVAEYSIQTSAVVQNINEINFQGQIAPMRFVTIDDIRRLNRTRSFGVPTQFATVGVDANANPIFRVSPVPAQAQNNQTFSVLWYEKPPIYTTADNSTIPPFPSTLLVQGLLAEMLLDEGGGEPTTRFQMEQSKFEQMIYETYPRYNGDTGSTSYFRPAYGRT